MPTKMLIADDDLEILELLKFTFESENYVVLTANDGEAALKAAKAERPDLIILDVNMPRLSGFEVLEKIREDSTTCLIPVIMLTSLSKTKDRITGIKLGADEYLNKPFEPFEILARVEGLLRRTRETIAANPLTGLPGNVSVEKEIRQRLEMQKPFSVIYTDVDNFKAFNDKYGFEKGDVVIKLTARILRAALDECGAKEDFLGNIGGEDFVIIVTAPEAAEPLARKVMRDFDGAIPMQYDEDVRRRGYLWGMNRQGQETRFPIMSISMGVVSVAPGAFSHYSQVVEKAKDCLKAAKAKEGSAFVKE